jgi:hypothetical protein
MLVSAAPGVLERRDRPWLRQANPRLPTEAARLVGLFLRSRENYTYFPKTDDNPFDYYLFYRVLTMQRLPRMWRYLYACLAAQKLRRDDIDIIADGVLIRFARALAARDYIGFTFYGAHGSDAARLRMEYHFDYLTLLIAGTFDALAKIAHRVYSISKPNERNASFRKARFQDALKRDGAMALYTLVTDERAQAIMTLAHVPRNSIHGASFRSGIGPGGCILLVPRPEAEKLWSAAELCGGFREWGLSCQGQPYDSYWDVHLEPYSYAVRLINEGGVLIDEIAARTDVQRLFPTSQPMPMLPSVPPANALSDPRTRQLLSLLG